MFTVTLALPAWRAASELVSVKPLVMLMLTVVPAPACASAATAVFQSVWVATSIAQAWLVTNRLPTQGIDQANRRREDGVARSRAADIVLAKQVIPRPLSCRQSSDRTTLHS